MTTGELRQHLIEVDPEGTLPVYVDMADFGWMCRHVSVYVDQIAYWEADEEDAPETGLQVVKIGQDDR